MYPLRLNDWTLSGGWPHQNHNPDADTISIIVKAIERTINRKVVTGGEADVSWEFTNGTSSPAP